MSTTTKSIPRKRPDHLRSRQVMADQVQPLDDEAREIVDELNQLKSERDSDERQIHLIGINLLERHPSNRTIDPADPSIGSLAESIKANGQLDPLRVRPIGRGYYQIISGERRFTALKVAGIAQARCVIVNIDDAAALREVAVANSDRQDLNPIQRAELMETLMLPRDKGGSGLSLTEAGALFGLRSESGCKNAIRMLKLPAAVRELLISGQLPERYVRALIPYAHVDVLMHEVVHALKADNYETEELMSAFISEEIPQWMAAELERKARPVSEGLDYYHPWPLNFRTPCLFDWKAHEAKLQIIEVPTVISEDKHGTVIGPRQWALNTKLWDKLQLPLAKKAAEEGKRQPARTKDTKAKDKPAPKLSPKEQAALDRKRAAEADKRLDTFTKDWIERLLRCSLSDRSSDDNLVALTLLWIVGQCPSYDIRRAHDQAFHECQIKPPKVKAKRFSDTLDYLESLARTDREYDVLGAVWRILLWPVTRLVGETAAGSELTPAGQLPDKITPIGYDREAIAQLAALGNVSVETAWLAGTVDDSDERRLISVWLCRHTKSQLHKLRLELNVTEGSETMPRDELADCILRMHRPGKPLKLPKRLSGAK